MNLLLAGDTHGNNGWISRLVEYATKENCDTIVQLGDFGYWEHTPDGREYLDKTSRKLVRAEKKLYFIDGNHENHPMLWTMYEPDADGFCEVRPNLYYIPRGHTWTWDGLRFMGLGGAFSIDKRWRVKTETQRHAPGTLWWPTETITAFDAHKAKEEGEVDVMFTHDCPWGVDLPGIKGEYEDSNDNRRLLLDVVKSARPRLLVHGHYHMRNTDVIDLPIGTSGNALKWHRTVVEGLDCDGAWNSDAWCVLNTEQLTPYEDFLTDAA